MSQRGWYNFPLGYGYDANGNLASQTYPSNLVVTYQPNALGQPTQVVGTSGGVSTPYASGTSYYPNGAIHRFTYGNNIVHEMQQNDRQLPASVSSGAITNFAYGYDANSNILQITDQVGQTGRQTRSMTYDGLDRLQTAESPMFGGTMTYGYDVLDNIATVVGPDRNLRYCYNLSQQLTFVRSNSSACDNGAAATSLVYDVQGNVASKNEVGYRFDVGNRLREVNATGMQERYRYDAHGRRVRAHRTIGPGAQTGLLYSQYASSGQLMYQENQRTAVNKLSDHIYLGGSLIALREVPRWGGPAVVKYQHTDALGSPVATTDSSGGLIERMEYEPYGKGITGGPGTTMPKDGPGYTGHVLDAATGLNYMQQRYYDPGIGRFLSVDPVTANSNTGGNFNRYWYANNSPYKFTDPDGRASRCIQAECKTTADSRRLGPRPPYRCRMGSSEPPINAYNPCGRVVRLTRVHVR
ncbi:MAG: RHS repeat-associated core domain-containing protein [Lysobacter sp.]|nr:RHS repeat-associated core domain-containing protein [Lysobacter sp.]